MPRGAALSLDPTWDLAKAWYHDRLDPHWRRKTKDESRETFRLLGLDGEFWSLP